MRYGIWLKYATKTAALTERDRLTPHDIFTFSWAKAAIQDIITLHEEIEHSHREADEWRIKAGIAERQLAALKDAVQAAALP